METVDQFELKDGAKIAVIGGGPAGAFFSIFALKMAQMIDKQIELTIFEPKPFSKAGPAGCNRCGGVISELLVQTLAVEGIMLPETVVQRGINSYRLHTTKGSVCIATPLLENTIATVYRGGGPLGVISADKESFDNFLLQQAIELGAVHNPARIDRIEYQNGKPQLFAKGQPVMVADLVVSATGVNSPAAELLEHLGFGYQRPAVVTTAIAEISLGKEALARHFGNAIQLFLLPIPNIKFAAMIPKGTYATLCILGKDLTANTVSEFVNHPVVKSVLPPDAEVNLACRCLPKMNVQAPRVPFTDRVVVIGDAGSTRLYKDGLGAAYLMGKAAALTAIFHGVGTEHFRQVYQPVYRSLIVDNWFGQYLFLITDLYKRYSVLTHAMLAVVQAEQRNPSRTKPLSSILWNMFTGNERYKNIFASAISVPMHLDLWKAMAQAIVRRPS